MFDLIMNLIDTHAHLTYPELENHIDDILSRSRKAGVTGWITIGTDRMHNQRAVQLAQRFDNMFAAVGFHPHHANEVTDDDIAFLEQAVQAEKVVAIGETGLDYHYDLSPRPAQRQALAAQLALASARGLPVVLHCREAEDDLMAIVDAAPAGLRGVLHSFMGSERLAAWALARGFYLGVTGFITFPKTETLARIVAAAPLDRLLVETDCPYLAPHPFRGRRNEPAMVTFVAERLAQVRAMPLTELAAATTANAKELFGALG